MMGTRSNRQFVELETQPKRPAALFPTAAPGAANGSAERCRWEIHLREITRDFLNRVFVTRVSLRFSSRDTHAGVTRVLRVG